jgi:hypothetical protein
MTIGVPQVATSHFSMPNPVYHRVRILSANNVGLSHHEQLLRYLHGLTIV